MSSCWLVIFLFSSGYAVIQPRYKVVKQGQLLSLNCSQIKTTYTNMYWFKQEWKKGTQLQMVAFSIEGNEGDPEEPFKGRFKTNRTKDHVLFLFAADAQSGDSGTYYCAKQDYTVRQRMRKPHTNLLTGKNKGDK